MRRSGYAERTPASVSAMAVGWCAKSSYTAMPLAVPRSCMRRRTPFRIVRPGEQQSPSRDQVDETAERNPDRLEVGINVRVVVFDVVHDGDVGKVFEEFRRLVEEGAVVLVALDDELAPAAEAIA